jgi:DNA-binding NarL/FixJ family response regulator
MDRDDQVPQLNDKQIDILARHASGRSIKRVALDLHYSPGYVNNVVQQIKSALHVRTLAACVMRAHALGYLSHPTGPDGTVVPLDVND